MTTARSPRLIGITGKAGSGKDSVGNFLSASLLYQKVAFADPIRRGINAIFDLPQAYFEHPLKESALPEIDKSPRQLMQTMGTEWGRKLVRPDLWLILANEAIQMRLARNRSVVVTDIRFENEARLVRDMGGIIWHLQRSSAGTVNAHISEDGVQFHQGRDILIDNNASLSDLYRAVERALA